MIWFRYKLDCIDLIKVDPLKYQHSIFTPFITSISILVAVYNRPASNPHLMRFLVTRPLMIHELFENNSLNMSF